MPFYDFSNPSCGEKQSSLNQETNQEFWLLLSGENREVDDGTKHHEQDGKNKDDELLAILLQDSSGHVVHAEHWEGEGKVLAAELPLHVVQFFNMLDPDGKMEESQPCDSGFVVKNAYFVVQISKHPTLQTIVQKRTGVAKFHVMFL